MTLEIPQPVADLMRKRDEVLDEATASILRCGWSSADCRIEVDTVTRRQVLLVRNVHVFEVTETWSDTKVSLAWRWLAEIPVREGFTLGSA